MICDKQLRGGQLASWRSVPRGSLEWVRAPRHVSHLTRAEHAAEKQASADTPTLLILGPAGNCPCGRQPWPGV